MHSCFLKDAVCTICRELKATHVRPKGALALTKLKENDCISDVIETNTDVFVASGELSTAAWFLPPSKNVSSSKPSLPLPSKLLAEGPSKALLLRMSSILRQRQSPHLLSAMKN